MLKIQPPTPKVMPMTYPDTYAILDPALLSAGIDIYSFYCQINPDRERRRQPIGVAMNKLSHRGKLVFSSHPILLPQECFISIDRLESEFN